MHGADIALIEGKHKIYDMHVYVTVVQRGREGEGERGGGRREENIHVQFTSN